MLRPQGAPPGPDPQHVPQSAMPHEADGPVELGCPDAYLGREHVQDAIDGPSQQQPPDQEAGQHHVGEEGAEIHHLQGRQGPTVGQGPPAAGTAPPLTAGAHEPPLIAAESRARDPGHGANPTACLARSQGRNRSPESWSQHGWARTPPPPGAPRGRGTLCSPFLRFFMSGACVSVPGSSGLPEGLPCP